MNHTEYTSLTAMITAIKAQINSLETILASIANQKVEKKKNVTAQSLDSNDYLLSEEEEEAFEKIAEKARKEEVNRMANEAQTYFKKEMDNIAIEVKDEPV